jgi:hypothetical protein
MSWAGTACADWHPGQRQEVEAEALEWEAGERAHLRVQARWKMAKQLAQDQTGADLPTMS